MSLFRTRCGAALVCLAAIIAAGCQDDAKNIDVPSPSPAPATETPSTNGDAIPALKDRPAPSSKTPEEGAQASKKDAGAAPATSISQANFKPLAGKVKFKSVDGRTLFSLKPATDGAKLVDGGEKELARFNVKAGRLKIKNPDDSEAGNIRISKDRLKIDDPKGEKLFEFQRQPDGDWKLDDSNENMVYKIKVREYGFEIETPEESSLYKVKLKAGKLSVRNAKDETVLSTKDAFPPLAAAILQFDAIESQPLRTGLAAAIALQVDGVLP